MRILVRRVNNINFVRAVVLRRMAWAGLVLAACVPAARPQSQITTPPPVTSRALLDKYCITCHNEKLATAGLTLDKMNLEKIGADAAEWEKVVRKLRTRAMPPPGRPRPDASGYNLLVTSLDAAPAAKQRLNR